MCTFCNVGYGLEGVNCASCNIVNCNECGDNYQNCNSCVDGYVLVSNECISCGVNDCDVCEDGDPNTCNTCI